MSVSRQKIDCKMFQKERQKCIRSRNIGFYLQWKSKHEIYRQKPQIFAVVKSKAGESGLQWTKKKQPLTGNL